MIFDDYKPTHGPARRKSHVIQSEKDAPMVLRGAAKEIAEDAEQYRRYRRHYKWEIQALMEGEDGAQISSMYNFLKDLTPDSAPRLFDLLEDMEWFKDHGDSARFLILRIIDDAIIRMRERNGLPPIDDSLPDEEPTVFEICRSKLNPET